MQLSSQRSMGAPDINFVDCWLMILLYSGDGRWARVDAQVVGDAGYPD